MSCKRVILQELKWQGRRAGLSTASSPAASPAAAAASSSAADHEPVFGLAKPFHQIPSPPRLPLLGHFHLLLPPENRKFLHKFFGRLRKQYGDIFRLDLAGLGVRTLFIFDPKDIRTVYRNDGVYPASSGTEILERIRKTDCPELFTETAGLISQGEEWFRFRQAVQQDMMRVSSAMHYLPTIEDISQELADKISVTRNTEGYLDPLKLLRGFSLESIGCMFLETRLGTLQDHPVGAHIIKDMDIVFRNSPPLIMLPFWLARHLSFYKQIVNSLKAVHNTCTSKIQEAIRDLDVDTVTEDSGVLAKIVKKCGKDSVIPVIMAADALALGVDTTGNSGIFLLYHLASNPESQEKLYSELSSVLGPAGKITEAAMAQLKYLKACQKESQRMLPVVFGSARRTQVEMVLSGYQIPPGTTVIRVGQVTSNDEHHFPQPEKFLPERWLRGCPERSTADPYLNLPFGHGPRACIGQRFAQLQLQVMAATIIRRFKLEYHGPPIDTLSTNVSRPHIPVSIKFTPR